MAKKKAEVSKPPVVAAKVKAVGKVGRRVESPPAPARAQRAAPQKVVAPPSVESAEVQPASVSVKDADGVVRSLVVGEVVLVNHRKLGQLAVRVVSLRGNQLHGTYARDYSGGVAVDTKLCRFRSPTVEEAKDFDA